MKFHQEHSIDIPTTFTCAACGEKLEASPRSEGIRDFSGANGTTPWLTVEWQIKPHTCAKVDE